MNNTMNILKVIGIFFVLAGHVKGLTWDWFPPYSFHIPLFVFISGYFYKKTYESNVYLLVKKRIRSLVIPYFAWNIAYGVIALLLANLGMIHFVYNQNETLGNFWGFFKGLFVLPWTFGSAFGFNGPAWFVLALFLIQVVYVFLRIIVSELTERNVEIYMSIVVMAMGLFSVHLSIEGYNSLSVLPLTRTLFGLPFFHAGYIYANRLEKYDRLNVMSFSGVLLVQAFLTYKYKNLGFATVQMADFKNIFLPFLSSFTGIWFCIQIAKMISGVVKDSDPILNYIGKNTWTIMTHHLTAFWLINTIYYKLTFTKYSHLFTDFDTAYYMKEIYYTYFPMQLLSYTLYMMLGIFLPITVKFLFDYLLKTYHQKRVEYKSGDVGMY